jgi:hypothetical protein
MPLSGCDDLLRFFPVNARALLLATALAAGVTSVPAQAQAPQGPAPQMRDLARSGAWTAYGGGSESGKAVCGVMVRGEDRSMHVKYFQGGNSLVIHVFKNSWNIPGGVEIPVDLAIDQSPGWTARAVALNNGRGIQFQIGRDNLARFEALFRAGNAMRLRFMEGDEQPWVAQLRGSNQIMDAFVRCMRIINQDDGPRRPAEPTQPYLGGSNPSGPTQPFSGPPRSQTPTQPFGPGGVPSQPGTKL